MEFSYRVDSPDHTVKKFLKMQGVSRRLLSKIKFAGGRIFVNDKEQNAIYRLQVGDRVKIITPDEARNPELVAQPYPLTICFEDEHYLILDKPAGVLSITSPSNPDGSMANYVAGYLQAQAYANQKVHVVTRLDRDTSGLMVFAKHSFAHGMLEQHRETFVKKYYALIKYDVAFPLSGEITAPIGRDEGSIIKRRIDPSGQAARTTYTVVKSSSGLSLLDVQIHTGRTHQIRVHFLSLGFPLLGDALYGGDTSLISRQALHCHQINFRHPFTGELLSLESELPDDMRRLIPE